MVNRTSYQARSGSNMTINTRRVLRPTICSVSKGNLAVMPEFFRRIMSDKDIFSRFNQRRFNCISSSSSSSRSSNSRRSRKQQKSQSISSRTKRINSFYVNNNFKESNQLSDDQSTQSSQGENLDIVQFKCFLMCKNLMIKDDKRNIFTAGRSPYD